MRLFKELRRRNVFRMGIAYVVVAWVLLQAIDFSLDIISAPNWVMQVFLLAGVAGLPVVLIFAWIYEMTPDGIKRESRIDRNQSVTQHTGQKLDRTIIVFLISAILILLAERFLFNDPQSPPTTAPTSTTAAVAETGVQADKVISVAVLPFVNMSSDPEQEYFSDGLSEELLNRLANNKQLRVAARTSSFQFKGHNLNISEIGRQLKVNNVLEGSVRKSGNRLRITAQLIEVGSGFHLWSETYEREINDIFVIQDDISLAIAKALEVELGTASATAGTQPTQNLAAYQLYLEARYLLLKRGEKNMLKAHGLFEQAVAMDPDFSSAWSGMAYNYSLVSAYGTNISPQQAWKIAHLAANKAIALNPGNAEAYVALARANIHDDFKTIQKLYEKAYELAPNNVDVLNLYADFMVVVGDFKTAEALEQKAIELDPLAAVHYSDMAFALLPLGRTEEGLNYGRTSHKLAPDSGERADALIMGLIATTQYDAAMVLIRQFEQQPEPNSDLINWWWCFLYYQQDDEAMLREKLLERRQHYATGPGGYNYTTTAIYTAWLDGVEAALPLFSKAYASDEWQLFWPDFIYLPEDISTNPEWLTFWQQPRLAGLMDIRRANKTQPHIGWWKQKP